MEVQSRYVHSPEMLHVGILIIRGDCGHMKQHLHMAAYPQLVHHFWSHHPHGKYLPWKEAKGLSLGTTPASCPQTLGLANNPIKLGISSQRQLYFSQAADILNHVLDSFPALAPQLSRPAKFSFEYDS